MCHPLSFLSLCLEGYSHTGPTSPATGDFLDIHSIHMCKVWCHCDTACESRGPVHVGVIPGRFYTTWGQVGSHSDMHEATKSPVPASPDPA